MRWLELSHTERSFEGLRDLIVKEQFIDSCPKELAIHLRERAPETLAQIAKIADQYIRSTWKAPVQLCELEGTRTAQGGGNKDCTE